MEKDPGQIINNMISAVIIAKNEQEKIADCIESVNWADEILVIDNDSIDMTADIAKRMGVRVIKITKGSYDALRNEGLRKAKGDWILYVDADERVTATSKKEIIKLTSQPPNQLFEVAFAIPRRNFIFNKEFKHQGEWPDYQKRLFLKSKLKKWKGRIHEDPVFDGELGHLENPLIHFKHKNIFEMIEKTNDWSKIEANLMIDAGHPQMNIIRFFSAMFREFWKRMIAGTAFRDGMEGSIYAIYQVYSKSVSYAKLWEMQKKDVKQW